MTARQGGELVAELTFAVGRGAVQGALLGRMDYLPSKTRLWDSLDLRLRSEFGLMMSRFEPMRVIEEAGHCRRRANPLDARSSIIELTPAGKRLLARARGVVRDELGARLAGVLPGRTLDQFAVVVATLHAARLCDTTSSRRTRS